MLRRADAPISRSTASTSRRSRVRASSSEAYARSSVRQSRAPKPLSHRCGGPSCRAICTLLFKMRAGFEAALFVIDNRCVGLVGAHARRFTGEAERRPAPRDLVIHLAPQGRPLGEHRQIAVLFT